MRVDSTRPFRTARRRPYGQGRTVAPQASPLLAAAACYEANDRQLVARNVVCDAEHRCCEHGGPNPRSRISLASACEGAALTMLVAHFVAVACGERPAMSSVWRWLASLSTTSVRISFAHPHAAGKDAAKIGIGIAFFNYFLSSGDLLMRRACALADKLIVYLSKRGCHRSAAVFTLRVLHHG